MDNIKHSPPGKNSIPDTMGNIKLTPPGKDSIPASNGSKSLIFTDLTPDATEEDLRELLLGFGEVSMVHIDFRQQAFVSFVRRKDSEKCLEALRVSGFSVVEENGEEDGLGLDSVEPISGILGCISESTRFPSLPPVQKSAIQHSSSDASFHKFLERKVAERKESAEALVDMVPDLLPSTSPEQISPKMPITPTTSWHGDSPRPKPHREKDESRWGNWSTGNPSSEYGTRETVHNGIKLDEIREWTVYFYDLHQCMRPCDLYRMASWYVFSSH